MDRPKILDQYEKIKKDVYSCSTPKCNADCDNCKSKVNLLELMDYINLLEIIVNFYPSKTS